MTKRFYVTMTWDDWPEGGSYGTVIEADDDERAEELCRLEMAESRVSDVYDTEQAVVDALGDDWETVDCFDLDDFLARHALVDGTVSAPVREALEIAGYLIVPPGPAFSLIRATLAREVEAAERQKPTD